MKFEAFEFRQVQNFRTLAIIAKREGITDIEALLAMLDRYIADKNREIRVSRRMPDADIKTHYTIDRDFERAKKEQKEHKKQSIKHRLDKTRIARSHSEKLAASYQCPECKKGRVIEEVRDGELVHFCTYPQSFREGFIKFESGCGWSKMVD